MSIKTKVVLVVCLVVNFSVVYAQNSLDESVVNRKPNLSERYIGGEEVLRKFIATNIDYPIFAMTNQTVGLSISSITISPEGKINAIDIVNPIDYSIDREVIRVLLETDGNWKSIGDAHGDITYYIQVAFKLNNYDYCFNPIQGSNIMNVIHVYAMFPSVLNDFKTDEYLQNQLAKSLKKDKQKRAFEAIDEMLKRNPIESKLYQLRIMINTKLKGNTAIEKDSKKMQFYSNIETY